MTDADRRRVRALFERLADLATSERTRVLDIECARDPALRRELEELLARDGRTENLPVTPVLDRLRPSDAENVIGPYRIERALGEGGFGEVFVAEQTHPLRRRVALKILKAGMDTKAVLARFEAERQAIALMDHPNIAKVYDAGETERGRPYFVMELVDGEPLTAFADRHTLSIRERLELFIAVAQAVQHAHQKGIIHRDLKPPNVLITEVDGTPVPKVIDFGIAKATRHALTEQTLYTEAGQLIGTPEYMSPEQAEMGGLDVDTRTDIYSLGVMLYELLTGLLPFDPAMLRKVGIARIQQIIREEEPPRPSARVTMRGNARPESAAHRGSDQQRLARQLRGDLDWIVLKAMEKDRARRYETANALAMDIARHLANEPVLARPPSTIYRLSKFARRHRSGLAAAVLLIAAILAGAIESNRQRIVAVRARGESEAVTGFLERMLAAADPREGGREISVREVLDASAARVGDEFADEPLIRGRIMRTIGEAYRKLGHYDEAREQLEASVRIREVALGSDHLDLAASLHDLAQLLSRMQRNDEGRAHAERALAIREKALGPDHPDVAASLGVLAHLRKNQGDFAGARDLHERALSIRERTLGPDDENTLKSVNDLAITLYELGEYEREKVLLDRLLSTQERILGPTHLDITTTLNNLALLHWRLGNYEAARDAFARALPITEEKLGPEDPRVATAAHNLGSVLQSMGDPNGARPYIERALAIREKALGPDHPSTTSSLMGLALLLHATGDIAGSIAMFERVVALNERTRGRDDVKGVGALLNLAEVLQDTGNLTRGRALCERALAICEKAHGPDHPEVARALDLLAGIEVKEKNYAEARRLYERAIRIDEATAVNHPKLAKQLRELAAVLRALGDAAAAESVEARAVTVARAGASADSS